MCDELLDVLDYLCIHLRGVCVMNCWMSLTTYAFSSDELLVVLDYLCIQ
jgi:hypothetical protein